MTAELFNSNPENYIVDANIVGQENVTEKLIKNIGQFTNSWFGYKPHSINAVFHDGGISVTITGILSEAERNVSGITDLAELIVKNHKSAFKTVRKVFEKQMEQVLHKSIIGSTLLLDPESDCATIMVQFK